MLEALKINLENGIPADTLLSLRQTMVDEAFKDQNIKLLEAISEIDKANLALLHSEKNKIMEELVKLTKIKNYVE